MSPLEFLFKAPEKSPASGIYELADISRESLGVTRPGASCTGYLPNHEIRRLAPETRAEEYSKAQHSLPHSLTNDMSKVSGSDSVNHEDNCTGATDGEDRCGMKTTSCEDHGSMGSFSYYYYADPDFRPEAAVEWMSGAVNKAMLDLVEAMPLTESETRILCRHWLDRVANVATLDVSSDADLAKAKDHKSDPATEAESSIFQQLHHQPVGLPNRMMAIDVWRGNIADAGLGPSAAPLPTFLTGLIRKHHSSVSRKTCQHCDLDLDSAQSNLDGGRSRDLSAAVNELPDILDEHDPVSHIISAVRPLADSGPLPVTYEPNSRSEPLYHESALHAKLQRDEYIDGIKPLGHHAVEATRILQSLQEFPVPDLATMIKHKSAMADTHERILSFDEYTPEKIRSMISILNARSTDVKQLKTFWESQH